LALLSSNSTTASVTITHENEWHQERRVDKKITPVKMAFEEDMGLAESIQHQVGLLAVAGELHFEDKKRKVLGGLDGNDEDMDSYIHVINGAQACLGPSARSVLAGCMSSILMQCCHAVSWRIRGLHVTPL
jgi:hypothetical protein